MSHYATLGVTPEAEDVVIQAAYRALIKVYHPDTGASGGDRERSEKLIAAYAVLSDPARRSKYDASGFLDEGEENPAPAPLVGAEAKSAGFLAVTLFSLAITTVVGSQVYFATPPLKVLASRLGWKADAQLANLAPPTRQEVGETLAPPPRKFVPSQSEREMIEGVCAGERLVAGDSAYDLCSRRQYAELERVGKAPSLTALKADDLRMVQAACQFEKVSGGPGPYYQCLKDAINALNSRQPGAGLSASQ